MTSFLLSIFLNLAKTEIQKEEVINQLSELQNSISNDEVAQQKFFTIFSIINSLTKMVNVEKNYEEFFKTLETYTKFLGNFVAESPFTVYLIKDHINDLSETIVNNIIKNKSVNESLRKRGVGSLFKIACCFKLVDVHLDFITNLLENDYSLDLVYYYFNF